MDFGALPPEVNSARMYAGPGAGSMLAAAAAWNGLAAELNTAAANYTSVISELTSGPWLGPSSSAMAAAAAPYAAWMSATAGQAELAATQAQAAAGAYESAFAMTVPPPVIAANRVQLASLVSTNILGQNTPAIAATEAQYGEMWAQDAAAMYGYAANSAATTANVTPFTPAPQTTNAAGLAAQALAGGQGAGTSSGAGVQSTLSQLLSSIQTTLQGLASPSSSMSSTSGSGLSTILSSLLGGSSSGSSATSGTGFLGTLQSSASSIPQMVLSSAINTAMFTGSFAGLDALQPLMTAYSSYLTPSAAPAGIDGAAEGAAAEGAAGAEAAEGALGSGFAGDVGGFAGGVGGFAGDLGGLAGLGDAASVGALSVPPSWSWAAAGPAAMLGAAPLEMPAAAALPLAGNDLGAGLGFPFMFGGLPRAAAMGAAAGAGGAVAAKYGSRLRVVARPPAAGYPSEPVSPSTPNYPVPAGFPMNGHAPPGYRPAIVYLPTNGHTPATV